MEGGNGGSAAAILPPDDEESSLLQRATNLSGALTRASRRTRRGMAKIDGQEDGADKLPAVKPSGDISVRAEAASARARHRRKPQETRLSLLHANP